MRRRHALQIGAAWALIPLVGCGASAPVPSAAPVAAGKDANPDSDKAAAGTRDATATAGNEAPAATPGEKSAVAAKDAPANSAPDATVKSFFSRTIARLGRNHGHVLVVSFDDVKAGAEKTYDLAGAAGHPHTATLSADEMKLLLAGQIVRTKSTTDRGHAHRVVVRCAPPVEPPEWVNACKFTSSGRDEHEIVITAADLAAQVEKTYDIQGLAGHAHAVTLSAADFQKLAKGGPVTLHSSRDPDDAHLHTCTIEHRVSSKS
jgi:hypothetical protein